VVERLPTKYKALISNPSRAEQKQKQKTKPKQNPNPHHQQKTQSQKPMYLKNFQFS
jgi:hypothetical protein